MDTTKHSHYERLLSTEKELVIDLQNITDQMAKTIVKLAEVRQKLKETRHLHIVREDTSESYNISDNYRLTS